MPGPRQAPVFADFRSHIDRIVRAGIAGGSPVPRLEAVLQEPYRLKKAAVLAIGKAAPGMYEAWVGRKGEPRAGLMVVPHGTDAPSWALRGGHPVPDESSLAAGQAVLRFVEEQRGRTDGFVVLLSGGASAIAICPEPGITVTDYGEATRLLLRAGADIHALNTVRRHIDRIKGGKLRVLMAPAEARLYAASDVAGDVPHTIGSGPLSGDPSTFADAAEVLRRFGVSIASIDRHIQAGIRAEIAENPPANHPLIAATDQWILKCPFFAQNAAHSDASQLGFDSRLGQVFLSGSADRAARYVADVIDRLSPPRTIVWSGETVVEVGAACGVGGRNQELALAAAIAIDGKPNLVIASFGTDGVDGPTDAAGAAVTGETCAIARRIGLDPELALANHDSHTFFASLGRAGHPHLIMTGPTGVNALDLTVALRY